MNTNEMEFGKPETQLQILSTPLQKKKDHMSESRATSKNDVTAIEDCLKTIYLKDKYVNSNRHMQILQDVLHRHGTVPNYEFVRMEGTCHEPIFKYRVWFNDRDAIGDGKSKREAKHSAAKAIINKLIGVDTNTSTTLSSDTTDLNSSLENNFFGNAIGWLQELCVAHRWAPPKYEIDLVTGGRRDRKFLISCVVSKHREVGHGGSKKLAKLSAAQKMWMIIQKEGDATASHKLEDNGFFESFSPSVNIHDTYYIQQLEEIAAAHQIDLKYKHIQEKTISGRFQCILHLSGLVVETNCQGTGTSEAGAHINAAHNAVNYLNYLFNV